MRENKSPRNYRRVHKLSAVISLNTWHHSPSSHSCQKPARKFSIQMTVSPLLVPSPFSFSLLASLSSSQYLPFHAKLQIWYRMLMKAPESSPLCRFSLIICFQFLFFSTPPACVRINSIQIMDRYQLHLELDLINLNLNNCVGNKQIGCNRRAISERHVRWRWSWMLSSRLICHLVSSRPMVRKQTQRSSGKHFETDLGAKS